MVQNEYELVSKLNTTLRARLADEDELLQHTRRATRQRKAGHLTRVMDWCASLFEAKPYKIKEEWRTIVWHMSKRLLTLCILVGAIALGVAQQSFDITDRNIWHRFQVNEDAQLAVFGLLNTLLALMVRDSLSHITNTVITKWMISSRGASPLDFEMYDETIKPWKAVLNTHTRRKNNGWNVRDGLRFAICVVTGVCLLLQGASMNTIGMPKIRWWPDTRFTNPNRGDHRFFITRPTMHVASVSYMSMWQRSFDTVRQGGAMSWEMAHALGAMSTLEAFESIHRTFSQPAGWVLTSDQSEMIRSAINVTSTPNAPIQALSIHGGESVNIWNARQNSTTAGIRRARGWEAKLKLNGIMLDTVCSEESNAIEQSWKASYQSNGTIMIKIGSNAQTEQPLPGATCFMDVSQALIEITQWIVLDDFDKDRPGYSIDSYGESRYPDITRLPANSADSDIAKQLSDWFNVILPNLQLLSSNSEVANLTSLVARLSNVIVELGNGHTTMDGLAVVLSIVFSNLLTTFSWAFDELPDSKTQHGPIRWQIYGSGPRLPWQWVAAAVIGVSIIIQIVDVFLLLWYRQSKGTWLDLGGMLVAANAAARMPSVTDEHGAGFLSDEAKFVRYYIRQEVEIGGSTRATLIDECQIKDTATQYGILEKDKVYG